MTWPLPSGDRASGAGVRLDDLHHGGLARTLMFLPADHPVPASAIAWTWMYSPNGAVNQLLSAVDPRDIRVGTWFRWVWLVGFPLAGGYFALFYLPLLVYVARCAGDGFAAGVGSARFWWSLLAVLLVYTPLAAALWMKLAGLRQRARQPGEPRRQRSERERGPSPHL